MTARRAADGREPTAADLAAIEAEWPVIAAELSVLDAEIAALRHPGGPSPLDWRRLRRARRQLLAAQLRGLRRGASGADVPEVAS